MKGLFHILVSFLGYLTFFAIVTAGSALFIFYSMMLIGIWFNPK
jgi:hypothetical protein